LPKSSKGRRKTARSGRRRRKGSPRAGRIFLITFGFLVILALSLYGAYYIKNFSTSEMPFGEAANPRIESLSNEADGIIAGALFEAGISQSDVSSRKVRQKENDGVSWKYREIEVAVPSGISKERVKDGIRKSFSKRSDFVQEFVNEKGNSLTASVEVSGLRTHIIKFDFPAAKSPPGKEAAKKEKDKQKKPGEKAPGDRLQSDAYAQKSKAGASTGGFKPKVAIIVDDIGRSKTEINEIMELPEPVTLAILPNLPHSEYAALAAGQRGMEVMLHLPMEPKESSGYMGMDAGEEVLLMGLPKKDILKELKALLDSVPGIKGVNNHMGSKFMENEELMTMILEEMKNRELFFVDSMTSNGTVGFETAIKVGMKAGKRDVFLDQYPKGSDYVKSQLGKLVQIAKKRGYAIGICHPYTETIKALAETMPELSAEVEFTSVSRVLDGPREVSER
jgi:polysaccharide deacetylase 2 family uncharacterized protein YibQ